MTSRLESPSSVLLQRNLVWGFDRGEGEVERDKLPIEEELGGGVLLKADLEICRIWQRLLQICRLRSCWRKGMKLPEDRREVLWRYFHRGHCHLGTCRSERCKGWANHKRSTSPARAPQTASSPPWFPHHSSLFLSYFSGHDHEDLPRRSLNFSDTKPSVSIRQNPNNPHMRIQTVKARLAMASLDLQREIRIPSWKPLASFFFFFLMGLWGSRFWVRFVLGYIVTSFVTICNKIWYKL